MSIYSGISMDHQIVLDEKTATYLAEFFSAFSDTSRVRIISVLTKGEMNVRNRGSSGTGHGWSGAQTLFWNCYSPSHKIICDAAPGSMNWAIYCKGKAISGNAWVENWNEKPEIRSLYLAQLKDRLGQEAVDDITIPEQREGEIYSYLRKTLSD